jgi:hypothetical protein
VAHGLRPSRRARRLGKLDPPARAPHPEHLSQSQPVRLAPVEDLLQDVGRQAGQLQEAADGQPIDACARQVRPLACSGRKRGSMSGLSRIPVVLGRAL